MENLHFPTSKVEMMLGVWGELEVGTLQLLSDLSCFEETGPGVRGHSINFEHLLLWRRDSIWEKRFIPAQSPPLCGET